MLFVSIFCNMNNRYYNTGYIIKSSAKKYFATHKTMFVFLSLLFLVALITGVFTGIKGADNISINNINDKTLIKYFKGDSGPFAFFITRLLKYIFAILFLFFCGKTRFCGVMVSCFIIFMSYSLGLNSTVFILLFGIGGMVNAIIVIIPVRIVVLALYIIMACLASKNSYIIKRYRKCCFDYKMLIKWIWFLLVLVVVTLIETIFINMFSSAFIFEF